MGTDNRDWYRDWWRKRTGYTERGDFRRPARLVEREKDLRFGNWHPVLKVLSVLLLFLFAKALIRAGRYLFF